MTDWGVPNWVDPHSYGDFGSWHDSRWHWEFVRRRPDVRKEFDLAAPPTYARRAEAARKRGADLESLPCPEVAGFVAESPLAKEVGLRHLPNPRISEQPDHAIYWFDRSRIPQGCEKASKFDPPSNFT